jgi:hypothetical protein
MAVALARTPHPAPGLTTTVAGERWALVTEAPLAALPADAPGGGAIAAPPEPEPPLAPAGDDLAEALRWAMAEHEIALRDAIRDLLAEREDSLLRELADVREVNRELRAALTATRADREFTRQVIGEHLQTIVEQRDAALATAAQALQEQQATWQQAADARAEAHRAALRDVLGELGERVERLIANEAGQRAEVVGALREEVAALREYQHDRDLRTEATLHEMLALTRAAHGRRRFWPGWPRLGQLFGGWWLAARGR